MNARLSVIASSIVLFVSFGDAGTPKSDDGKNIQGTWQVVSMAIEGRERGAEDIKDVWYKISATDIIMLRGEKNLLPPRKYSIEPTKKPKHIDIVDIIYTKGKDKGKDTAEKLVMPGIYELDKDTLRICWDGEGVPDEKLRRPTEFKAVGNLSLVVLKRKK